MATPSAPARAILVDLEDVLLPWNTVSHWQWAWRPLGPKLPDRHTRSALRRSLRGWDRRRWRGLVGTEPPADLSIRRTHLFETLHAIARHRLPEPEATAVVDRFDRPAGDIESYGDVPAALQRLAHDGIPVGVATELPLEAAQRGMRRAGLPALPIVAHGADPVETRLPAKAGFRAALQKLGVPATRAVYVGDLFWSDVRSAARAGLTAVLLDRYDRFGAVEVRRIATFAEVPGLLPGPVAEADESAGPETGPADDGPDEDDS